MKSHDAIVVGAGPAGSTCAARLKQAGMRVSLFDKKQFPRVKPCAGWVTPPVIDELKIDVDEYRRDRVFQPITGFRTGVIGRRTIETTYPQPVSYGILRIEFDHYLLQRCGVTCTCASVKNITRQNGLWRIGETAAPLLVGAGGYFCPVGQMARISARDSSASAGQFPANSNSVESNVVYAQEIEFPMSARQRSTDYVHPEIPELYFCSDLSGYGWCFRKGDHLNIGLGRLEKSGLSDHVQQFCDFLRSRNKLIDKIPGRFLGHAYRIYADRQPVLFNEGLLLIGDAAGIAYPYSGEGIRPAVESAIIAADVIECANEDFSYESLMAYEHRMLRHLGPPKSLQMAPWLPVAWLQAIAKRLMATRWFAKNMVIDSWFLHRQQETMNQ